MRMDALELVCCPACDGRLNLTIVESVASEVISGWLRCEQCSQPYRIAFRMPLLYVDNEHWKPKAREAEGWVGYHKKLGIYDQAGVDIDYQLPYYPQEPWLSVARHFDVALKLADLSGREVVLDLGTGRGWAAKRFASKGCRVAAIDVVSDEQVGLGRAYALMDQAGVRFEPVIGDSENLPFFPNTFDLVFCAAVLHHTSDLPGLLKSVYKVLKPGGRLIAVNEPCISQSDNPQHILKRDASEELAFGINESRPKYVDYWSALHKAGFHDICIFPIDAYDMSDADLEAWAVHLGAIPPPRGVRGLTLSPRLLGGYARRWWNTRALRGQLPRARTKREMLIQAVLINNGGSVIILARR